MNIEKGKFNFIPNCPCEEDLFEGKSHTNIAESIKELILHDDSNLCKVIGIDGGWGAGKSNLVKLVEQKLKETEKENKNKIKYHFFLYDAWGHQCDLQRRTILEELTIDLTKNKEKALLNSEKWNDKLKNLLAKKHEVNTKTIPKISCGFIVSFLALILTPILDVITNKLSLCLRIIIMAIPLFLIIIVYIVALISSFCEYRKKKKCRWIFMHAKQKTFSIYSDKERESTTFETIFEDEPSSNNFRQWLKDINNDLGNTKLVIVFDNMDRLPKEKVQELWAAIHTFFADTTYSNIIVIVPFDRLHIKSAFKTEDITTRDTTKGDTDNNQSIKFGDDFINKTFNVVYRVSPPTMSNWNDYFNTQWNKAFNQDVNNEITQIYGVLEKNLTPRNIIAFINEFVTIKQLFVEDDIPDKYVALFIMGKDKILSNPDKEILEPSYLGALEDIYSKNEDLPKYISALYYQLPSNKALDIIYTDKLTRALDNKNIEEVGKIRTLSIFFYLLNNVIVYISNIPNAVLTLAEVLNEEDNAKIDTWDKLYNKYNGKKETRLQEYQKVLLQRIKNKEEYLKRIIEDLEFTEDDVSYYNDIKELGKINGKTFDYLIEHKILPKIFLQIVDSEKDNYKKYKLKSNDLDGYLSKLSIDDLDNLSAIPYIENDYNLEKYKNSLVTLINQNASDKNKLNTLYNRLKEIQHPIQNLIQDNYVYSLFNELRKGDDFYIDVLCMRIAKTNKFNSSYISIFDSVLKDDSDSVFVKETAKTLLQYMNYKDIIINVSTMKDYALYKAIVIYLLSNHHEEHIVENISLLTKYENIVNVMIEKEPNISSLLIECLETNTDYLQTINKDNVREIPIRFFEDAKNIKNEITRHCISIAIKYLKDVTKDDWNTALKDINNYDYKLLVAIQPREKLQNCFEAFKDVLLEDVKNTNPKLSREMCKNIISLSEGNKRSLNETFKNIRDEFVSSRAKMTNEFFTFYGEWLLKYSDLEKNKEYVRTILITDILDDEENVKLLLSLDNKEKVQNIINNAGDDAKDFKDKVSALINENGKYKDNTNFIAFANKIGVYKEEDKNN